MKVIPSEEVIRRLRAVVESYGSQAAAAKALGVSDAYVSAVMTQTKPPSKALLVMIGVQKVSVFIDVSTVQARHRIKNQIKKLEAELEALK